MMVTGVGAEEVKVDGVCGNHQANGWWVVTKEGMRGVMTPLTSSKMRVPFRC